MSLRDEVAAAIATAARLDPEEAWVFMEEADAAIEALARHLARQPEDGLEPAGLVDRLRARLALAETRVSTLELFRARDEAADDAFYERVRKLVHGQGTVEAVKKRLREAADDAAEAIWTLATRVVELEQQRERQRTVPDAIREP